MNFQNFFKDEPVGSDYQSLARNANRNRLIADQLQQSSSVSRAPQRSGSVTPAMGLEHGLSQLGEALLARRAGKKADRSEAAATDARTKALAQALGGTPYEGLQSAIDSGADPGIIGAMMKSNQPQRLGAGDQLVGPDGQVVATNENTTGGNSRYKSPQITESGRLIVQDGATGRAIYSDTGEPWDSSNDKISASNQIITLPDGSMQVVNMRQGVGSDQPQQPRAEPLVSAEAALIGAAAKEAAVTGAGEQAQIEASARADLPRVEQNASQAMQAIDALINHPGFSGIFGKSGALGVLSHIPGTDWADADALLNQVKGKTFLEAFQTLKGGGQITELEGTKAEQAIARLSTTQSDDAAKIALLELKEIAQTGLQRARALASGGTAVNGGMPQQAQSVQSPAGGGVNWSDLQ